MLSAENDTQYQQTIKKLIMEHWWNISFRLKTEVLEQKYALVSSLLFQVPVFNHAYGVRYKLEKLHSRHKNMQVFWDVMLCDVSSGL